MKKNKEVRLNTFTDLANVPMWNNVSSSTPIKDLDNEHLAKNIKTTMHRLNTYKTYRDENKTLISDYSTQISYNESKIQGLQNQLNFHQQEIYKIQSQQNQIKERDNKNNQAIQNNEVILANLEAELKKRGLSVKEIFDEINNKKEDIIAEQTEV